MTASTPVIWMLNGPNLDKLDQRDTAMYGVTPLSIIEDECCTLAKAAGYTLVCHQSAHEGVLIDWVHEAMDKASGLIINGGAYSHTSIALMDALAMLKCPIIEVHLSNIHARESFRHHSYIASIATGVIAGFGKTSYTLSIQAMINTLDHIKKII